MKKQDEITKELNRITEKGACGIPITPEEKTFLHTKLMENIKITTRKEEIAELKEILKTEKENGIGSIVFLHDLIINPETNRPVASIAEYIHVLEKEEETKQKNEN